MNQFYTRFVSGSISKIFIVAVMLLLGKEGMGQTTNSWTSTSSTAWLTTTNWSAAAFAGSKTVTTNNDIAYFNINTATTAGINMSTQAGNHYLGAVNFGTSATTARTINNSSTTVAGVLNLNGATLNSVSNTIIWNQSSATHTFAVGTAGFPLSIGLSNTTENIITIDGTGGITINPVISGTSKNLTKTGSGSGVLILSGANTYTGTTKITAGELRLNPPTSNGYSQSTAYNLNGGTLSTTGSSTRRPITLSTLTLSASSKIVLESTNADSLTFANSNAISWTGTLSIYAWQGANNGTAGTKGHIFFGNSASGLTSTQLSQITIYNGTVASPGTAYAAVLLSTGELVAVPVCTTQPGVPSASNIASTTADIAWTTSSAANYDYEVRTAGAAGSGATGLTTSGTQTGLTVSLTGLTASTFYSVYVRSNCGGGGLSAWTSAGTFTTSAGATPTLSRTPSSLANFGSYLIGNTSGNLTFSLSGTNLTPASGNITIDAPNTGTDFDVSTNGTSFSNSVSVSYTGGALGATTIYVRFHPTSAGSLSGNVDCYGGGVTTGTAVVGVSGTGVTAPSISSFTFNTTGNTSGYFGSTITINGSNFTGINSLTIGGQTVTIASNTGTVITGTISNTATTSGSVVISNTGVTGATATATGFTYSGFISTATGNWGTNATWLGTSATPPSGANVTIASGNNVSANATITNNPNTVTINSGGTLTITGSGVGALTCTNLTNNGTINFNNNNTLSLTVSSTLTNNAAITFTTGGAPRTITISSGGSYVNGASGTITAGTSGSGIITFAGSATVSGTVSFPITVNVNGAVDFGSGSTVTSTMNINSGGSINTNPPTYSSTSTLVYNTTGTFNRSTEWSTSSGAGYPNNVTITNTTTLDISANGGGARICGGNLFINDGSTLTMGSMTNPLTVTGNLTVGSAALATLTLSSASGGDLNLKGNYTQFSTSVVSSTGRVVEFSGAAPQTINSAVTFDKIKINNSANVTLAAQLTVSSQLDLTSGKLILGTNTFILGVTTATIINSSASSYVQTTGSGQFRQAVGYVAGSVYYPVGNSSFNPITLDNTGGTADVYGVNVTDVAPAANNTNKVINRRWFVTESSAGGSNLTVSLTYNAGIVEEAGGFGAASPDYVGFFNTSFTQLAATVSGTTFTSASAFTPSTLTGTTRYFAIGRDDAFVCATTPAITSFTPSNAFAGDVVTIVGTNLTGLTSATIGGVSATVLTQTGTGATIQVGAGLTGVINVAINGCNTNSSSSLTFNGVKSTAAGNWSSTSTWQGGVLPVSGYPVIIDHAVTLDANTTPSTVTINSTGTLTVSNNTNTLTTTTLDNNGTLICTSGMSSNSANLIYITNYNGNSGSVYTNNGNAWPITLVNFHLLNGSTYNHNATGSSSAGVANDFPGLTTRTLDATSNVNMTNWANGGTPTPIPTTSFGNLTVNIPSLAGTWSLQGAITSIAGDLNIISTGSTVRELRLQVASTGTAYTLNIGGNLNVSGGNLVILGGGSAGTRNSTVNVAGNLSLSGTGKIDMQSTGGGGAFSTINLSGDLSITNTATFARSNTTSATVTLNFLKATGPQAFSSTAGGISTAQMNWNVGDGTTTYAPTLQLNSDFVMNGSFALTVLNHASLYCQTNTVKGTTTGNGTLTLNSGSTLGIGSTVGIVSTGATGNVQTFSRTYPTTVNYTYNGVANQATGAGLPATVASLTINNTGGSGANTVTLSNATITTPQLNLVNGLFELNAHTINISTGGAIAGTGGDFTTSTTGTLAFPGTATLSGTVNYYPIITLAGAVNFGSASTIQSTLQMNSGGSVVTNAPLYGSTSTLLYYTGGTANRGLEWSSTSGAGYPKNVTIDNSTILNLGNGGTSTARSIAGSLTITNNAKLKMNVVSDEMTAPLTIGGDLHLDGQLSLSTLAGGDLYLKGDYYYSFVSGSLIQNGRKVFFSGSISQTLFTNTGSGTISFDDLEIDKPSLSSLDLNSIDLTVANQMVLTNGIIATGSKKVTVSNNAGNAVAAGTGNTNYTAGWVNGNLRRNFASNTDTYDFPVGSSTTGNLLQMVNNSLAGVTYLDCSIAAKGGNDNGLSISQDGTPAFFVASEGEWKLTPDALPSGGTYDLRLYFNGFTSISGLYDNYFSVIERPDGSTNAADWVTPSGSTHPALNTPGMTLADGYAGRLGMSTFSLKGIAIHTGVLPLTLTSFTASAQNAAVVTKWETAMEKNVNHFEIERSTDGSSFEKIGTQSACGNCNFANHYTLIDENPAQGVNYYRLKSIDNDGKFSYSMMVAVMMGAANSVSVLSVYPNPANSTIKFDYTANSNSQTTLKIYSVAGKLLDQFQLEKGTHTQAVNTSEYQVGMYLYEVISEDKVVKSGKFNIAK